MIILLNPILGPEIPAYCGCCQNFLVLPASQATICVSCNITVFPTLKSTTSFSSIIILSSLSLSCITGHFLPKLLIELLRLTRSLGFVPMVNFGSGSNVRILPKTLISIYDLTKDSLSNGKIGFSN